MTGSQARGGLRPFLTSQQALLKYILRMGFARYGRVKMALNIASPLAAGFILTLPA